jgi:hypothetical protein
MEFFLLAACSRERPEKKIDLWLENKNAARNEAIGCVRR